MKNLSWFNKVVFCINVIVAIITLVGYFLPFLAPKLFPVLSVFTLFLPGLLIVNLIFVFYWGIQFKKQVWLAIVILLLGITFINKFYKFSGKATAGGDGDFTLMSYNVRLFNLFKWIESDSIPENIKEFIDLHDPDVLCLQEFSKNTSLKFNQYPYRYIVSHGNKIKTGQAIFSKYRIIDKGEIRLPNNSNNNVVFADILVKNDTVRVYSIHLQSFSIKPDIHEMMDEKSSKRNLDRMSKAFAEQQLQSELVRSHMNDANHPKIICGDMNNSAYSYVYRNVKGDLKDAFIEAGHGFGKTFDFDYFPMRIDYVFVDNRIEVKEFKTYSEFYNSDHFPLVTRLKVSE
ncbi:endonuclease/exonuclease/phosphatase family protein [Myroides sp. LoEW2-1]|uniref:endonuclease/exonuclease/phosphatase family protein n=1 Tax=Myroides sp. LoEW2-1 TaxID=2683192 RepID=UPI00132B4D4F|nr:endonuclease/exonuclease/phosphatase family protein [Myroides sp. LoEW2-1]MVX34484.1 endonuclease [Myroides sp. LoEW2-1]